MASSHTSLSPNQRLTEYATRVVAQRVERLAFLVERTSQKPKADAVHRLRVSARRLWSALDAFAEHFPARGVAKVQKKAKRLRRAAGGVRDRDIAVALATEVGLGLSDKALARVEKGRLQSAGDLSERLEHLSQRSPAADWSRALRLAGAARSAAPSPTAASYSAALLPEMAQEYFEAGHEATAPAATIESLHAFRILGKRFRYTLELFAPCYGENLREELQLLGGLQDILGMINDCETAATILKRAVSRERRQEVDAALHQRQGALIENFRSHWHETFAVETECREWMQMLARPAFTPGTESSEAPTQTAAVS